MTSSRTLGRLFAGASLLALPALLLIPGCGGGGNGPTPDTAFQRVVGVELLENSPAGTPVVFDRGNLTVGIVDSKSATKTASGTLQLLGSAAIVPTPTATVAGATPALATGTINLHPTTASYLLTGTATYTGSSAPFAINMRGALKSDLPFTLAGSLEQGSIVVLRAQAQSGSVVIPMRVVQTPFAFATAVPTPAATTAATTIPNATPVATGTATATGTPTGTALATPTTTPVSPVGTPVSPVGTPVSPTTPF